MLPLYGVIVKIEPVPIIKCPRPQEVVAVEENMLACAFIEKSNVLFKSF